MLTKNVCLCLVVIVIGYYLWKRQCSSKEDYLGVLPNMTTKVVREVVYPENDIYTVPSNYQNHLTPRFSNTNYGSFINYHLPEHKHLAVDHHPLGEPIGDYSEDFSCGDDDKPKPKPDPEPPVKPTDDDDGDDTKEGYDATEYPDVEDFLPGDKAHTQPIIYDRYIYANRNSRLNACGDPIRGDLPILPATTGWFRPSVHPHIDLKQGALAVIGGHNNDTSKHLQDIIEKSSGGAITTHAGVNLTHSYPTALDSGENDVLISSFP